MIINSVLWHQLRAAVLIVNGVYDLACSIFVLFFPMVQSLHLGMFLQSELDPLARRLMGYWIMTYGAVRLLVGIWGSSTSIAASTYFIEAVCVAHEGVCCGSIILWKCLFVSCFSGLLGVLVLV